MSVLARWHSGAKCWKIKGLPNAAGMSTLARKIALARLENGQGHEIAAITPPPLKRGGFRPCAGLYVPSFRPFCGVSMRG